MTKFSPELRTGLEILRDQIVGQSYDANGITSAVANNGSTYGLLYDAENRMNAISQSGLDIVY